MVTSIQPTLTSSITSTSNTVDSSAIDSKSETKIKPQVGFGDIKGKFVPASGVMVDKPELAFSKTTSNSSAVLKKLEALDCEHLQACREALAVTPENAQQKLTEILQSELNGNAYAEELLVDAEMQLELAKFICVLVKSNAVLKEDDIVEMIQNENKTESVSEAKRSDFAGIKTNEAMSFLLDLLRKVMAELSVSERRITTMFSELSAKMTEAAAESTIKEGKEIFRGALIGFGVSIGVMTLGFVAQGVGLNKQNQAMKTHLKNSNLNKADSVNIAEHAQALNSTNTTSNNNNNTFTDLNGDVVRQAKGPDVAQLQELKADISKSANLVRDDANLHAFKFEQKINQYRTMGTVAEQISRQSDTVGNLANQSNLSNVKAAEADKMVQNTVSEVARGVRSDKEGQVSKEDELVNQMTKHIHELAENNLRTAQALVRG